MRRTGKLVVGLIGMFGAALFTGCASQDSVDNARTENRTLIERNQDLQSRLTRAESEASQERQLREGRERAYTDLEGRYNTLRSSLGGTEAEMARLENMIREQGLIDPATDRALRAFAAANPGMVTYDSSSGMIRFASDVTFDSGQDVVKSEAKTALAQLAQALSGSSAGGYELHIVGHTDAQKMSAGTAQRHISNVGLSAHRAMAVRNELASAGIPWERMMVAGWGEHRPIPGAAIASNGSSKENRRVEIFLTSPRNSSAASGAQTPTPTSSANVNEPVEIVK